MAKVKKTARIVPVSPMNILSNSTNSTRLWRKHTSIVPKQFQGFCHFMVCR